MPTNWNDARDLVALEGGPKHGQWYWADELSELQAATRRAATRYTPASALACLDYVPAGRQITRHIGRDRGTDRIATATIYTYQPKVTL